MNFAVVRIHGYHWATSYNGNLAINSSLDYQAVTIHNCASVVITQKLTASRNRIGSLGVLYELKVIRFRI